MSIYLTLIVVRAISIARSGFGALKTLDIKPSCIIPPMDITSWRLIISDPAAGAWNMALDEAILESITEGLQPVTVRLYAWTPACLSLGYAQSVSDADIAALERLGWQLVRRPTGGRAILHTDELTYSVCAHQDAPLMAGGILESYRRISHILIRGLSRIGIDAVSDNRYDLPEGSEQAAAVCFEVPSNYEVTANGKKLIGSAQARKNLGVLQHGSLPLFGDVTRIIEVLNFEKLEQRSAARSRLLMHAVTAADVCGTTISWVDACSAIKMAFEEYFSSEANPSIPSPREIQLAEQLVAEKYSNPTWTYRL